jgi:hypothetical protein
LEGAAMSAAEALEAARAVGIRVEIDGDDLVLEAPTAPPPGVLDLLSRHKAGIVMLLRLADDGWSAEDWQVFFDERAGIAEFDGGLSRRQAEARAFACCAVEWLNRNPMRSESTGDAWPHSRRWPAGYVGGKGEAVAAMEAMGIVVPANLTDDFEKNGSA